MKCITYGWVVVLLTLLSILLAMLGFVSPELSGLVGMVGTLGLLGWWVYGFWNECSDGYFSLGLQNRLRKEPM